MGRRKRDTQGKGAGGIGPRQRRQNADKLVGRFPVTTLAEAVAVRGESRRKVIERFVRGRPDGTFTPLRKLFRRVYGSQGGIDGADQALIPDLPPDDWPAIDRALRATCDPEALEANLHVGYMLFKHARETGYVATNIDVLPLRIGRANVSIGINFYLTQGERLIFQFPHLRKSPLSPAQASILGSLISFGFVQGDYAAAEVEIISFAAFARNERVTKLIEVPRADMWSREQLESEIDNVYDTLWRIARGEDEPQAA